MSSIRTRMAPSPTGEYHIGSLRTLLFNYAFARRHKGQFIMRIEDTDQKREVAGAVDRLLDVIKDYGFDWDEFYVQSERMDIYREHAEILVDKGHAYYCFCSAERLDEVRKKQQAAGSPRTVYDKKCRNIDLAEAKRRVADGEAYVIRMKTPENEEVILEDAILGQVRFNSSELDDSILLKSDGFPTYHLAVVIDDHLMNITHIMRGNEWIPSAPKHVLLYKFFGWDMPVHAHLPNLKEKDANKKMSKRYGNVHARAFLEEGYLPEAMVNFLMFLGWNPGTEKELYTLEEFISEFDLKRVHKTDLVAFDRDKLLWLNGQYIRNLVTDKLYDRLNNWALKYEVDLHNNNFSREFNLAVVEHVKERLRTFAEFPSLTHYFYVDPVVDEQTLLKFAKTPERKDEIVSSFVSLFESVSSEEWVVENLEHKCHKLLEEKEFKPKEAFMTLRVVVTGETKTPPIFDILETLGKDKILARLSSI